MGVENGVNFQICVFCVGMECKKLQIKVPSRAEESSFSGTRICKAGLNPISRDSSEIVSNTSEAKKRQVELGIYKNFDLEPPK